MTTPAALDLDGLTLADVREGALRDRPVTVLGLARSGIALARFFVDAGARVTVYDGRPAGDLTDAIAALGDRPVQLSLGPDVDPQAAWAGATLVATSPSISPDFPTTEPRLRAALRRLVDAREGGDLGVPALVSEADLFLRLCPVPTVGVTGTKGKTTTSSLTAAILAAEPAHPVILGGNIGLPLIERLDELTPAHRVVDELSELQLPTLSRGTTVAVYTNVTADHLDRHGSLEAYRRVKRLLADRVDPAGALVLNAEDPVVAGYEAPAGARTVTYRRSAPTAGGLGVVDGWIVADGVAPIAAAGAATGGSTDRPDHARRRPRHPGGAQRLERAGRHRRRSPVRCRARADPARGDAPSPASSTASNRSRRSTACASSMTRKGPSPTRSSRRFARSTRRSC